MEVEISGQELKKEAIMTAAAKEWPFADWDEDEDGIMVGDFRARE
jgi:hypothetical protein